MQEIFNPFNLVIIAIAIVILLRLRSVLGRRTGSEKRPFDPYSAPEGKDAQSQSDDGKIIPLPGHGPDSTETMDPADKAEKPVSWPEIAEKGTPLDKTLHDIVQADPDFDPANFLSGARIAYEMIVTAFAKGDTKALKPLLSRDVFEGFAGSIKEREQGGHHMESEFIGIETANIVEAGLDNDEARVTVRFRSELVQATLNSDGDVIEGDPDMVREVSDIWTFARNTASRDPNWKLVATESAN